MGPGPLQPLQLGQGVRQPHQDQIRAAVGVDAQIVVLGLDGDQGRAAQPRRQPGRKPRRRGPRCGDMGGDGPFPVDECADHGQGTGDHGHRQQEAGQQGQAIDTLAEGRAGQGPDHHRQRSRYGDGQHGRGQPGAPVRVQPAADHRRAHMTPDTAGDHHRHPVGEAVNQGGRPLDEGPAEGQEAAGDHGDHQRPDHGRPFRRGGGPAHLFFRSSFLRVKAGRDPARVGHPAG